jgi:hypothetical protein
MQWQITETRALSHPFRGATSNVLMASVYMPANFELRSARFAAVESRRAAV